MGRPIRKDRMTQNFTGDEAGTGKIAVSNYRTSGSNTASTTAYVVAQRSSRKFKIHLEDSTEVVYTLVTDATLSVNNTFNVKVVLNDSTEAYVERFYNRTVHYVTTGGDTGTATYTLGAEGSDEGQAGSGAVSIDVI